MGSLGALGSGRVVSRGSARLFLAKKGFLCSGGSGGGGREERGGLIDWRWDKCFTLCWNALSHTCIPASTFSSHSSSLKTALQRATLSKWPTVGPQLHGLTGFFLFPWENLPRYECWSFLWVLGQRTLFSTYPQYFHIAGPPLVSFPLTE